MNRKTARKVRRNEMAKVTDGLKNVDLDSQPIETAKREPIVNLELNRTTVLYLSNKEFNKNGIEILNELLLEADDPTYGSLHRLLFSGKEEAKQLLEIECKIFLNRTFFNDSLIYSDVLQCKIIRTPPRIQLVMCSYRS